MKTATAQEQSQGLAEVVQEQSGISRREILKWTVPIVAMAVVPKSVASAASVCTGTYESWGGACNNLMKFWDSNPQDITVGGYAYQHNTWVSQVIGSGKDKTTVYNEYALANIVDTGFGDHSVVRAFSVLTAANVNYTILNPPNIQPNVEGWIADVEGWLKTKIGHPSAPTTKTELIGLGDIDNATIQWKVDQLKEYCDTNPCQISS